jgi:hypothetical protein
MPAFNPSRDPMRSKEGRRLAVILGAAALATSLIGLAHAPFARTLLMSLGGCPMAGARMTLIESENARRMALAGYRGDRAEANAPTRPALVFSLDSTTVDDARSWARRVLARCEEPRVGLIRCANVGPDALGLAPAQGVVGELALEFDLRGHLVNMTTFRTRLTPEVASQEALGVVSSLARQLGPAAARAGDFAPSTFGAPPELSISLVTYRYADYIAEVTGINAPSEGPTIREHYMSAKD